MVSVFMYSLVNSSFEFFVFKSLFQYPICFNVPWLLTEFGDQCYNEFCLHKRLFFDIVENLEGISDSTSFIYRKGES